MFTSTTNIILVFNESTVAEPHWMKAVCCMSSEENLWKLLDWISCRLNAFSFTQLTKFKKLEDKNHYDIILKPLECFLQCFDTVGLHQEQHLACKKLDVDLLMVTILFELCTSYSSSCHYYLHYRASIKSRMETF